MPVTIALTQLPTDLEGFLDGIALLSHRAHLERAEGFKSLHRRAEFLAGRRLCALLCQYLQIDFSWPSEQEINDNPGQVVHAPPGTSASISHSGRFVLAALGQDVEHLGVDCESGERRHDPQALANRHFTDNEARSLASLSDSDRNPAFLRHWVLKEAWLKATGQGIAGGLQSVELLDSGGVALHSIDYGNNWHFWQGRAGTATLGLCWQARQNELPEILTLDSILVETPDLLPAADISGQSLQTHQERAGSTPIWYAPPRL